MKKFFLASIFFIFSYFFLLGDSFAQANNIKASVEGFKLDVQGFAAPFASIVMLSKDDIFIASSVSDQNGKFVIEDAFVVKGFSDFCIEVVDLRRIGDSYTCISIKPVVSESKTDNLFFPPTLGLSGRKITPGSSIIASGYTLPNIEVVINISKDIKINTRSDSNGYYEYEIKNLSSGNYSLFSVAVDNENNQSEVPTRVKEIQAVSGVQYLSENIFTVFIVFLALILVIIFLIILLSKKIRSKFMKLIRGSSNKKIIPKHHSWFIGF